jgi:saccharopine dehydrogenase-like NADP-dependent oxidoreductase
MGLQGKAALHDLARCEGVDGVICADADLKQWEPTAGRLDLRKVRPVKIDASSQAALTALLAKDVDVAIDLLPLSLMPNAFAAAVEAGVPLVSTNYGSPVRHLDAAAAAAGIALMPECGLDPGIDLVICGHAVRQFDALHMLDSYCGGIPERKACDNPLNYKISWNWDMVLRAQKRASVFIQDGRRLAISAADQHCNAMIHRIPFPGLGELEAIPNGDAVFYADMLGVSATIRRAGRYALRWPGWCAFWHPLKHFGFLGDQPLPGAGAAITPHRFVVDLMGPQLQYRDDEKDLVVMVNVFEGIKDGRKQTLTTSLLMERDLTSGLLAMSLGVGCTASIVAQMIAGGRIGRTGVLNPAVDVPYAPFMAELSRRGIRVETRWS